LKLLGVVASNSTATYAPLLVNETNEREVKEEQLVVIEDNSRSLKYLGVIRRVMRLDTFLLPYRRTAYADNPDLVGEGSACFGQAYIYLVGIISNGSLEEVTIPPNPGSKVYSIENSNEIDLNLGEGLVVGVHKYSGLEVPLQPEYLFYHVAVIGSTGTGKSRLVKALVDEILEKTDYSVIIFDHTGVDYSNYYPEHVVKSSEIILDPEILAELILSKTKLYRERQTYEKYYLLAILHYLLSRTRLVKGNNLEYFATGKVANVLSMVENMDFTELLRKMEEGIEWTVKDFKESIKAVFHELMSRRVSESARIRALLSIDLKLGKPFFDNLSQRRILPERIVERSLEDQLVVVDMSHDMDLVVKRYIVSSILSSIWKIIEENKKPLKIIAVVDEAHNYASEAAYGVVEDIERIAREGRKWGYGIILATQRIMDIAPKIRGNINTVFFSRLQTQNDFRELSGFINLGGIDESSLAILGKREFYVAGLMNPLKIPMLLKVKEVS